MVFQDGPDKPYGIIPLPCASEKRGGIVVGGCSLDDFMTMATPKAFKTVKEWCSACDNTQMAACSGRVASQRFLRTRRKGRR